jgi:hypothetical protein
MKCSTEPLEAFPARFDAAAETSVLYQRCREATETGFWVIVSIIKILCIRISDKALPQSRPFEHPQNSRHFHLVESCMLQAHNFAFALTIRNYMPALAQHRSFMHLHLKHLRKRAGVAG